ncbi:MAG: hypothetical protein ABW166_14895 [Sedimenticola sp.]
MIKKDETAKKRQADKTARRKEAGQVSISTKIWVPENAEVEAREILRAARKVIEAKFPVDN